MGEKLAIDHMLQNNTIQQYGAADRMFTLLGQTRIC